MVRSFTHRKKTSSLFIVALCYVLFGSNGDTYSSSITVFLYVLINDLGDSIDLSHRRQVTLLSTVVYYFILIMDFQHFIDVGERLNLEGPQLHAFVEKELDKIRIKEEAAAAREDRAAERTALKEENESVALKEAAERVALKESEERRMQH